MVDGNHKEYERLGTELTSMANALKPFASKLVAEDITGGIANIMK